MKINLIIFSLAALFLVSCDQSKNAVSHLPPPAEKLDPNVPGWKQNKTHAELTWFVGYAWYGTQWGKDIVTQKIEKDTNTAVTFIPGDDTKLNSLLVSRTRIPDIITIFNGHLYTNDPFISKIALPMDVLAKKYDPYFFKIAKPQVLKWETQKDGHFYGYPNNSYTSEDYDNKLVTSNNVFLVRKDLYEGIGSHDMSTPDGFINALLEVKKKYPKVDGLDIIPLGMNLLSPDQNIGNNLQRFLGLPNTVEGKIYDKDTDPEYISWLKVFNRAFKLGLITNDVFTDNGTIYHEKVAQARYFTIMTDNLKDIGDALRRLSGFKPNEEYIAVNGPAHSDGRAPKLESTGLNGWTLTFISNNCKNPEKAMQLVTYLLSEQGQITTTFGVEGVTFRKTGNDFEFLPEVQKARSNTSLFGRKYGMGSIWQLTDNRFQNKYNRNTEKCSSQPTEWTRDKVVPKFECENIDPDSRTRTGRNLQKIITKRNEILIKLIRAQNDEEFNKIFEDYLQFRKELGFKEIQDYRNKKITENIEKLNRKTPDYANEN